ncbi:MAG: hypothetical protein ACRDJU_13685, partial [Actinomycetota bacterium]
VKQYRPPAPPLVLVPAVTATVRSDGSWSTTISIPAHASGPVYIGAQCESSPGPVGPPEYTPQPFLETTSGNGYWLAEAGSGPATNNSFGVIGFGDATTDLPFGYDGNIAPDINGSMAALAPYPLTGAGYWLAGGINGGVIPAGDAPFFDSGQSLPHLLNAPVVGIAATPDGKGYWLAAADGGVFGYGDAPFLGSATGELSGAKVVGIAATSDGKGYWLAASNGGVFAYGDAGFYGSAGGMHLNRPIVGITASPDGQGYWLVTSDGGVFAYGDAGFYGSAGGLRLNKPVVGIAHSADGHGYWLAAVDGGLFAYEDAPFLGSGVGLSSLVTTGTATYSAIAASPVTTALAQPVGAGPGPAPLIVLHPTPAILPSPS